MAISPKKTYQYQESVESVLSAHFEVRSIQLEESCLANQNHRSEHYKIFFIEDGEGKYDVDFQSFEIKGAGIFFLSPEQVLTVNSEKLKTCYEIIFDKEFYCVEAHGKAIACNGVLFNNVHRSTFIPLTSNDAVFFRQLISSMIQELENPKKAHREMLETYLRMLLIQALRLSDEAHQIPTDDNSTNQLVGDFIALVNKHFRKIHAVAKYAEMLYVSPKSLTKRLHLEGYPTPTEVIRERIVLEAKRDLRYSQKSVKNIAFDLGFDDPAYFTRFFKKAEKQSPQSYRTAFLNS